MSFDKQNIIDRNEGATVAPREPRSIVMAVTVSLSQGSTLRTSGTLTLTLAGATAGDAFVIKNGTTDVTKNFTPLPANAPADGNVVLTAKSGVFTGQEALSLSVTVSEPDKTTYTTNAVTGAIDTTAPTATKITQGATVSTAKQITFTAPESGDTVTILNGSTDVTSSFTSSNIGLNDTLTANPLSFTGAETLSLTVLLTDRAGNVSLASNAVKGAIDTTPPVAPTLTTPTITSVNQPIFNGTSEAGATIKAYQNNSLIGSVAADSKTGAFQLTPTAYVSIGDTTVKLTATDLAGNTSTQSASLALSIGGVGFDTPYSINASAQNFTLAFNKGVTVTTNHVDGSVDNIINFNSLQFNDQTINLSMLQAASTLTSTQIKDLSLIYIGYFNRAPDAVGLSYWASREANGMSLKDISKSFFYQPETDTKYSSNLSVKDFVSNTYQYVLGRAPDASGLAYWTNQINNGAVARDSFVLSMVNGARAATGSATDTQFLANKATVAYNFSINNGLNDVVWAYDVISKVTDSASTVSDASAKINSYSALANDPKTSELVVKLVGITP